MKLHYQNTIEDLVAFSRQFHQGGPLVQKQARSMAIVTFLFVLLWCIFIFPNLLGLPQLNGPATPLSWLALSLAIAIAAALAVAVYFLWKPYMLHKIGRAVRRLYRTKPDKVACAPRELEITPGHLIERNNYAEIRWKIAAIEQITSTSQYVFICITPARAYILPRECFHDDELDEFLDELERAHAQPPPLSVSSEPTDAIRARIP